MKRSYFLEKIQFLFKNHPVVAILGPRQVGKTTLSQMYADNNMTEVHHYDLEDPKDLQKLENPMLILEKHKGLVIIDEIQRRPELFPIIRVLADQKKVNRQFLILGSASRELINQSSESLAGRIAYFELPTFCIRETSDLQKLWIYGGYPKVFLDDDIEGRWEWLKNYTRNFIERDIPALGIDCSASKMRQLWNMLAHYNANKINYSELSRSLEKTSTTIKNYVDILQSTLMISRLQPWHANISKRQVKTPKIFFKDTGILHYFLGISSWDSLIGSPHLGASWESFALKQILYLNNYDENDCYYWSTHQGPELDLLVMHRGKRLGYEFKFSEAPEVTKSMHIAMEDLKLDSLTIVNPGPDEYQIDEKINVLGLKV